MSCRTRKWTASPTHHPARLLVFFKRVREVRGASCVELQVDTQVDVPVPVVSVTELPTDYVVLNVPSVDVSNSYSRNYSSGRICANFPRPDPSRPVTNARCVSARFPELGPNRSYLRLDQRHAL